MGDTVSYNSKPRFILTAKELAEVQQPLDGKGKVNEYFIKLYAKDMNLAQMRKKNPYVGTNRDTPERRQEIQKQIDQQMIKKDREGNYGEVQRLDNLRKDLKIKI